MLYAISPHRKSATDMIREDYLEIHKMGLVSKRVLNFRLVQQNLNLKQVLQVLLHFIEYTIQ